MNGRSAFLMPPIRRADRIMVFQCYLDDSYDPPSTGVVTLAGYFGTAENWANFEDRADSVLNSKGVPVFHTKEFRDTDGHFQGWTRDDKENLIVELFDVVKESELIGVSKSVSRGLHKSFRKVGKSAHTYSPLAMAFGPMASAICFGNRIPGIEGMKETHFFVESGNTNNNGLKKVFDANSRGERSQFLRSITFMAKGSCRAIQLADFCAYYSRKIAKQLLKNAGNDEIFQNIDNPVKIAFTRAPHFIEVSFGTVTQDLEGRGRTVNVGTSHSVWVGPSVG